jgi:ATP sulfurylase
MQNFFVGREIRAALQSGKPPNSEVMRPEVAKVILQYENPFVT